ncbi:oxaloacetate tautomerase FAHD1, mitochondrial-like [Styela clava]
MTQQAISRFWEWGRKILCVGRNYREHCLELKNPLPKQPLIFTKPTSAYLKEGNSIVIPKGCEEVHHEVELGIVIGKPGTKVTENNAMEHVAGYVLALDMTARDWQSVAKSKGWPWTMAKGFDTSCPIGNFIPKEDLKDPHNLDIWLKVNGLEKQKGNTSDMIFNIPFLISFISQHISLESGDLILTGTPEGVGPVHANDVIDCGLGGDFTMSFNVTKD